MARVELCKFEPHRDSIEGNKVVWNKVKNSSVINGMPLIFWSNGEPWREANMWAHENIAVRIVGLSTVQSNANSLVCYANWLEENDVKWWDFPARKSERCLIRYRGSLVESRNAGRLAPSTATQRMRVVIRFYRWLEFSNLLSTSWPLWEEKIIGIHLTDAMGFDRTISVRSTDISIPNRAAHGERLEGGLLPVSLDDREFILKFANDFGTSEIFLMLALGFFTGMRVGTIADLKVDTLFNAVPDPLSSDLYRLSIGPAAVPSVHTKFGVTGQIWIPYILLVELKKYSASVRRLKREATASTENKDLLFLTRFGNSYLNATTGKCNAVNVEMHALRNKAIKAGTNVLSDFKFHQSRCTYATELARIAIRAGGSTNAIQIVKEALLHKNESTSLKYIRFVEKSVIKSEAANDFTAAFLGCFAANGLSSNE